MYVLCLTRPRYQVSVYRTIGPLVLNCFSVLFVKIRRELSEIRGTEMLFINMFGHDAQQQSPGRDIKRTLCRQIMTFVYSRRRSKTHFVQANLFIGK